MKFVRKAVIWSVLVAGPFAVARTCSRPLAESGADLNIVFGLLLLCFVFGMAIVSLRTMMKLRYRIALVVVGVVVQYYTGLYGVMCAVPRAGGDRSIQRVYPDDPKDIQSTQTNNQRAASDSVR